MLRKFIKRFEQVVLQVEFYSMDVVLQIFKRSIFPGMPFFESLAKKPPVTMEGHVSCGHRRGLKKVLTYLFCLDETIGLKEGIVGDFPV